MKTLTFLSLVLAAAASAPLRSEAAPSKCAFGETTAQWQDRGELSKLGLSVAQRQIIDANAASRLSKAQSYAIHKTVVIHRDAYGVDALTVKQALASFIKDDGFVTLLAANKRQYVYIASYSGGNESGLILDLRPYKDSRNEAIAQVVAHVNDQDISDCKVLRQ